MLVPSGEYIENLLRASKLPKFPHLELLLSAYYVAIPDNALNAVYSTPQNGWATYYCLL